MTWPKSRYVRYLESELERERDENRRLWDALLMQKGLPPLTPPGPRVVAKPSSKPLPSQWRAAMQRKMGALIGQKSS